MDSQGPKTSTALFGGTQVRDDGDGPVFVSHRLRLTVIEGPDRGRECKLVGNRLVIGTASNSDLVLSDQTVSRRHCELEVVDDRYVLRDLASTNGTVVDGTPVIQAYLTPGARIRLGDSEILFEPRKKWERVVESSQDHFGELYGTSAPMREVFSFLGKVAATDLSCLLSGETGTGKELAARALHEASARAQKPFIVVDCGAISENLTESELFGHERGAFTGADRQRPGAFELAEGGTVFLDEIGELPLHLQPKLLRVLERREVKRLGAARSLEVDVRVVAATHRDLPMMVQNGQFREDLYYRISEVVVSLPPLRERREDVELIARRILAQAGQNGGTGFSLDGEALKELQSRPWMGNVRELRNVLRRSMALAQGNTIRLRDLQFGNGGAGFSRASVVPQANPLVAPVDVGESLPIKEARESWIMPMEREYLKRLVRQCAGDLDRAAERAGVHRKSLERLLRQHGIRAADLREES